MRLTGLSGLSSENWPFDSNLRFRLQRPDLGIGGHRSDFGGGLVVYQRQ